MSDLLRSESALVRYFDDLTSRARHGAPPAGPRIEWQAPRAPRAEPEPRAKPRPKPCPVCGKAIVVNGDGRRRAHTDQSGRRCKGSNVQARP